MLFLSIGNINAIAIECDSCDDCTIKLNGEYGEVYLNTSIINHTGTCINNPANFNNKIFDCQGHTIDGDNIGYDYGIYLIGKKGNTIRNCVISNFNNGIFLWSTSSSNVTNNNINLNYGDGIMLYYSNENIMYSNNITSNGDNGMLIKTSRGNIIINNTCNSNNGNGIYLRAPSNWNNVTNNRANNNQLNGLYITASTGAQIINSNIFCNNNQINETYYDINGFGTYLDNKSGNNICDTTYNWNDNGATGCEYTCEVDDWVLLYEPTATTLFTIGLVAIYGLIHIKRKKESKIINQQK